MMILAPAPKFGSRCRQLQSVATWQLLESGEGQGDDDLTRVARHELLRDGLTRNSLFATDLRQAFPCYDAGRNLQGTGVIGQPTT
jgi:hypothetical protein